MRPFNFHHQAEFEEEVDFHQDEDLQIDVPDYRQLISIHAGKLKGGLESWLRNDPDKVRRLSLSEQELENAARTHGTEIVRYYVYILLHSATTIQMRSSMPKDACVSAHS